MAWASLILSPPGDSTYNRCQERLSLTSDSDGISQNYLDGSQHNSVSPWSWGGVRTSLLQLLNRMTTSWPAETEMETGNPRSRPRQGHACPARLGKVHVASFRCWGGLRPWLRLHPSSLCLPCHMASSLCVCPLPCMGLEPISIT